MRRIGNWLLLVGIICIFIYGYQISTLEQKQDTALAEATQKVENIDKLKKVMKTSNPNLDNFSANTGEAFATLEIPKLDKELPVVEGTDPDSLDRGVGHLSNSVFPGQGEQILLSGHRDTVFRDFGELEIGDQFVVNMPYGTFIYEIRETEIVPEDDTSVIRDMGEEVLVVTTCYPFHYIGGAPERFVTYAYPVDNE